MTPAEFLAVVDEVNEEHQIRLSRRMQIAAAWERIKAAMKRVVH